jgi:hypothetical protein
MIYDGSHQILRIVSAFSQLSRRIFLDFSTFNRKIFWFFKFRAEKNTTKNISRQKRSGRTNVQAENFWPEKLSDRTSGTRSAEIFPEHTAPPS